MSATPPDPREPALAVAMVLLSAPRLPGARAIAERLAKRRPVAIIHESDALTTLTVNGEESLIGLVPAKVPWSNLEGPCETAWWWPAATAVCRATKAHLIVSTRASSGDVFEASLRLTDLVAAVAQAADAPAIYWGAGTLVHETGAFSEEARHASRALLPLRLWVDFRMVPMGGGQMFFATTGLRAFGLMELECVDAQAAAPRVLDRLFNVAHYLCDKGPVLGDGHTLGLTPTERIRIHHRASRWPREGDVIFLSMDG